MTRRDAFRLHLESKKRLYAIATVTEDAGFERAIRDIEAAKAGGASVLQLRAKGPPDGQVTTGRLVEAAKRWQELADEGTFVIINDRPDACLLGQADGVHLGQDDLPVTDVRELLPEAIIGLSTHNLDQVKAAQTLDLDYIALGPVFATKSKAKPDPTVGLDGLRAACAESAFPVVAIGGIGIDRATACVEAGARAVAVIGGVFPPGASSDTIAANAQRYCSALARLG